MKRDTAIRFLRGPRALVGPTHRRRRSSPRHRRTSDLGAALERTWPPRCLAAIVSL